MSAASDALENGLMLLLFNGTNYANVADNAATSPFTNWYFGLNTGDPGDSGNQTTNEAAYTSYAREAVARTSGGFTVTGGQAVLAANLDFTAATGGSETETHFSIGSAASGTGILKVYGAIAPNIVVSSGVQPRLTTATAITLA